jgi:hypothetical protein
MAACPLGHACPLIAEEQGNDKEWRYTAAKPRINSIGYILGADTAGNAGSTNSCNGNILGADTAGNAGSTNRSNGYILGADTAANAGSANSCNGDNNTRNVVEIRIESFAITQPGKKPVL